MLCTKDIMVGEGRKCNERHVAHAFLELGTEGDRVKVLAREISRVKKGFQASTCS